MNECEDIYLKRACLCGSKDCFYCKNCWLSQRNELINHILNIIDEEKALNLYPDLVSMLKNNIRENAFKNIKLGIGFNIGLDCEENDE